MAFVVEDGTGKSNANSYVSYADSLTYFEDYGDPSSWSGASQADAEEALRMATQYIDNTYAGRWRGTRGSETQALAWPRMNARDDDTYFIDSDSVPQKLQDATCEAAIRFIDGSSRTELMPDISEPGEIKEYMVKVDTITEKTVYMGGRSQIKAYMIIENLLSSLVEPMYNIERA